METYWNEHRKYRSALLCGAVNLAYATNFNQWIRIISKANLATD